MTKVVCLFVNIWCLFLSKMIVFFLSWLLSEPSRSALQRAQACTQTQSHRQAEEQAKDSGKVCVEGEGEKRSNSERDGGQQSVREDRCVCVCKLTKYK